MIGNYIKTAIEWISSLGLRRWAEKTDSDPFRNGFGFENAISFSSITSRVKIIIFSSGLVQLICTGVKKISPTVEEPFLCKGDNGTSGETYLKYVESKAACYPSLTCQHDRISPESSEQPKERSNGFVGIGGQTPTTRLDAAPKYLSQSSS
ncbi:hypothetical protein ARMSODRAFT_973236 [Armillaria solidipes]|uniref:Uncharacterized protein n=1 Tax=Armillaria solidipes TaxID=1076256 RepID=A0A2H3BL84_9AGAR|nr:hypothetical protein ARMSODRAFT_973236 [Armillaria solidipes]